MPARRSRPEESNLNLLGFNQARRPHTQERDRDGGVWHDLAFTKKEVTPPASFNSLVFIDRCPRVGRTGSHHDEGKAIAHNLLGRSVAIAMEHEWMSWHLKCRAQLDPGPGIEPGLYGSEPHVLPLDEPGEIGLDEVLLGASSGTRTRAQLLKRQMLCR